MYTHSITDTFLRPWADLKMAGLGLCVGVTPGEMKPHDAWNLHQAIYFIFLHFIAFFNTVEERGIES